ncbi:mitochondrial carrier domain-containing protein [Lipomyces japonicus]|uniref:mitochondrial carrier domain-containing protein n=1 Tax=Lipomyces japonicus TaxID=56871 RepID=UPI0034CE1B31
MSESAAAQSSLGGSRTTEQGPPRLVDDDPSGPGGHGINDSNITTAASMLTKTSRSSSLYTTQSKEYIIKSGIAGGIAGCAAKSLIAPLDRVKILFQTSSPDFAKYSGTRLGLWHAAGKIYRADGVLGLFQGHSATLLRIFPYAAIKFVVYEQIRSVLIPNADYETNLRRALSGSLAGVTSVFFTYPLELVRVRLAYQTRPSSSPAATGSSSARPSFVRTCKQIFLEGAAAGGGAGLHNFYRGFSPTVLGMLPYAGVSFWTHDTIHDVFRSDLLAGYAVPGHCSSSDGATDRRVPLAVWAQLTAGGLAGMASQTASYPLEVIRRRMQVGMSKPEFATIWSTASTILNQRGIRGFFVGLSIGYLKVIPMVSCSFLVYERMKIVLGI